MITLENIHKSFGEVEVLKGVSVAVPEGSVTALIGPEGTLAFTESCPWVTSGNYSPCGASSPSELIAPVGEHVVDCVVYEVRCGLDEALVPRAGSCGLLLVPVATCGGCGSCGVSRVDRYLAAVR